MIVAFFCFMTAFGVFLMPRVASAWVGALEQKPNMIVWWGMAAVLVSAFVYVDLELWKTWVDFKFPAWMGAGSVAAGILISTVLPPYLDRV